MKVLVLGGTGAIGKHLVNYLSKKDVQVYVTSRRNISSNINNIHYIKGNAHDNLFLEDLLKEKWDCIVDFMVYTTEEFNVRIDSILQNTCQYVFLSSSRVYADADFIIKESSPRLLDVSTDKEFLLTDEYALSKARQENILKESKYNNWTIIRPYITYSEQRFQLGVLEKEGWLYRALHGRTIVFSSNINNKVTTMTYGTDVAKAISETIGKKEAFGETFHITTEEYKLWSEILMIYVTVLKDFLGKTPKVLLQDKNSFFTWRVSKYQVIYDRLYNRRFDNSKINKFVETKKFSKVDDKLKECLIEFLEKPIFKNIDWREEALKDRATNEFTPLHEIKGYKNKMKYLVYRFLGKNPIK